MRGQERRTAVLDTLSPFQRRLAGASLIAFVGFLYVQDVLDPTDGIENAGRIAAAADHPNRLFAAATFLILSSAFMLPSIAVVVALVRERGKWLAWIGGGLALLGALGHVGVAAYYATLSALSGGDAAEMSAFLDRLDDSATAGVVIVPAIAGFALGVFALGFALARSRVLPVWTATLPALALAIEAAQVQPWPQLDLAQTIAVLPFVWLAVRLFEPPEIATAHVARAELEA
jgi:hypothetical protein